MDDFIARRGGSDALAAVVKLEIDIPEDSLCGPAQVSHPLHRLGKALGVKQQRTQVLRDLAQARYALLLSRVRLMALVGQIDETVIAQISESLQ